VTVSLAITTAQNTGGAGTDSVSRFENLTGSAYADTLIGSTGNNVISGGGGNDSLNGANGRDTLDGGSGADTMAGGSSHSTYLVDDTGDVIIEGAAAGNDTVLAAAGSYTLPANVEYLTYTGVGNFTGAGNDLANTLTGAAGEDALDGGAGNDKILGGGGNDSLTGGDGNDSLTGGAGADTLTGALGADRFIFTNIADFAAGASYDTIADFTHSQTDRIDLSLIDAKTTVAENQAFTFIGAAGFHNIAGELHYAVNEAGLAVSGDVNGDGVADFRFDITGMASLVSGDFYL
jgi:Ca2+-binding RTX toxin-like protein